MKIFKNFLDEESLKQLEFTIMNSHMPWYYNDSILVNSEKYFQFTYSFFADSKQNCHSDMINLIEPILKKLQYKKLISVKANLLTNTPETIEHGFHVDKTAGKTGIFYMNTCNGYTRFKNNKKIKSERNKYIEFDSKLEHTGASCTDEKRRVVINFNYQ
jgi:hypothetical protein